MDGATTPRPPGIAWRVAADALDRPFTPSQSISFSESVTAVRARALRSRKSLSIEKASACFPDRNLSPTVSRGEIADSVGGASMTDRPKLTAKMVATGAQLLASPPTVYVRLRQLLSDPTFTLSELTKLVSTDPALAARLLRVANSTYFGGHKGVDTVRRALVVLGTQQIHDIVLATSVISRFTDIPVRLVDMHSYWQASVLAAAAAKLLADRCFIFESERMFTAGLLAQLGQLVLYLRVPSVMSRALEIARHEQQPIHLVERELLGFDYAEVGGELFAAWQLPPSLVEPIRHHINPVAAADRMLEASVVAIAVTLAADADPAASKTDAGRHVSAQALEAVGLVAGDLEPLRMEAAKLAHEGQCLFLAAA